MEAVKLGWPPLYQPFLPLLEKEQPNSVKDLPAWCTDAHRTQGAEQNQIWQSSISIIASFTHTRISSISAVTFFTCLSACVSASIDARNSLHKTIIYKCLKGCAFAGTNRYFIRISFKDL